MRIRNPFFTQTREVERKRGNFDPPKWDGRKKTQSDLKIGKSDRRKTDEK